MTITEATRWVVGLLNKGRSHDGKQKYGSHASALRAVKAMEKKAAPKRFDAYRCIWCFQYHIGRSVRS